METSEKIKLANKKAKGQRPYFLAEKQTEQVLSIAMSLAMELNVANERIATLEKILEAKGILTRAEVDGFIPDGIETQYRSEKTQHYLARVLRILQQDQEEINADEPSISEVEQYLRSGA
ncbi:hypothetical protein [Colwellia sp. MEBiC06753]